jgi:hypothetical protein
LPLPALDGRKNIPNISLVFHVFPTWFISQAHQIKEFQLFFGITES